MRKFWQFIFLLLVFLSILVLILKFGSKPLSEVLGLKDRSGLRIESTPVSRVLVDQKEVGKTPYESDQLEVGDHQIEVRTGGDSGGVEMSWRGNVPLNPGTVTVVNRELTVNTASSSGEVIALEKGQGAIVISTPSGAELTIDGKSVGKTPVKVDNLDPGEHVFILGKNDYLKRSIRAALKQGYRLSINVDLALSEADLTKVMIEPITASQSLVISDTPTGFLRVRSGPSTGASEVGRVNPGDTVTMLEQTNGWYRIRLNDGKEGYISTSYAKKK